jgi:hypothetical protein
MNTNEASKTSGGRIVGGVLLILFALVGGFANFGRNPVGNVSTIIVMALLIFGGLKLMGLFGRTKV